MRKTLLTTMLLFAVVTASVPALAATPGEFYLSLLRRGSSDVEAGRHADALNPLRLAAFGFVDSVEQYETAQVYLAVAYDRLTQPDQAREAATRVVAAERVERRYASLPLPASIRTAFDAIAKKVLASSDIAVLNAPVATPVPQQQPAPKPPMTASAPAPAPATTQVKPQPVKPAPTQATSAPATSAPTTSTPAPVKTLPQTASSVPAPAPAQVKPQPQTASASAPAQVKPQPAAPQSAAPQPQPSAPQPQQPARVDVPARLAAGERALSTANLTEARRLYREVLAQTTLDRTTLIRAGEGLYRARDFAGALSAFQRLGTLRAGEEPYGYYIAVALYETGEYDRARKELAAALPHIELTSDVARYRAKIEGAVR